NITIKNNTFNDNFIEGNYLLTSLNSGNVLANNTFNIPEDSFSQLAYEIDHLEGNELVLTHNYTYYTEYDEDYNNGITIDKSIIIDGQGYTINGFNLASIFKVNANVTIKNIKFINGTGSILGGAIYLTDEAINASVSGCSFDNCYALSGGAIFCENVDCSVSNCSFNNCSAMFGGAICCLSANGSVCDCNFTDCYAWFGGAIHWSEEDTNAILTDCCFVNCYALSGGAIYSINVNGYVDDCTFVNCSANNNNFDLDDEDYDCWGGAIFWYGEYLAVNSCNFTYCTAEDIGSAIYTLSSLNITNSTSTAVVGDDKAPIYNEGTILSDVVITTMGGEDKYVIYGDTVNLTATVTTSGIAIAGGELKFTINSQEFTIESDNEGIYSVPYTVDFYGTKSVNADYLNCDGNQIVNKYNITVGVPHKLKTYIVSDYNGENVFEGKYGEQLTLNFIVYDENGGLVNSGNLTLWFNGKAYSATVENGYVTITDESLVLNSTGLYSYVIDYSNSNNLYANSFNFTNINIPKVTTQISIDKNVTGDTVSTGKVTLMINVTDVEAKVNVNKGFIYYVSPDGIGHTVNVTNGSVEVVIDVNRTGEYDIAVSYYDLDDDFLYSSADFTWNIQFTTTLISVNSVEDNLIATVRVVDDLGNNAKGNLDLFINGKKLELTILNGFATFNLVEFSDSVEISAIFTGEDGLISYDNVVIELVKTPENSYNSYESLESDLVNDTGDVDKTKVVDDNSTSEDNKSKTAVVAGIPMQNTAIPIIALILALLTLPLVYRRKL
ncbi:MAG: hypothetical protein Q4P14_00010, partial [Methanobacteriaceae archaeon]|nr:hypothetical protein [Methanobacteriaceae archaeon]